MEHRLKKDNTVRIDDSLKEWLLKGLRLKTRTLVLVNKLGCVQET